MKSFEKFLFLSIILAIGLFDFWTIRSSDAVWHLGSKQTDYYNQLIDGWQSGHLSLKVAVPEALLKLKDPYDPTLRPPGLALHDASFYRGKYYLYFGVTPVGIMLPFRLITGMDMPLSLAVWCFVYTGYLLSVVLLLKLRKTYFKNSSLFITSLSLVSLGLVSLGPVLLRRPQFWELTIAAGYACMMFSFLFYFKYLLDYKKVTALSLASLGLSLAIASRPTYLVALPVLFIPLFDKSFYHVNTLRKYVIYLGVPLVTVGLLVAYHNYLRFDNPFEFGQRYQLSSDYESKITHFSFSYVGFNAWRYFLSGADFSHYFPFITPAHFLTKPKGMGGDDQVYGILVQMPFLLFFIYGLYDSIRRPFTELHRLIYTAFVVFCFQGLLICTFFGSISRYAAEITPALVLVSCIGLFLFEKRLIKSVKFFQNLALRSFILLVSLVSWLFVCLYSLSLNNYLAEKNPAGYETVSRLFNVIPGTVDLFLKEKPYSYSLTLTLKPYTTVKKETIVEIKTKHEIERVFISYLDKNHIQLGFKKEGGPDILSKPILLSAETPHTLNLILGRFLYPATHPFYHALSPRAASLISKLVMLSWDNTPELKAYRRFEIAPLSDVKVLANKKTQETKDLASCEIIQVEKNYVTRDYLKSLVNEDEKLTPVSRFSLEVTFDQLKQGITEPLMSFGEPNQGDILGVRLNEDATVCFVYRHKGDRLEYSPSIRVDRSIPHSVEFELPWLKPYPGRHLENRADLQLTLDHTWTWKENTVGFAVEPESITLGENTIDTDTSIPRFSGTIRCFDQN